MKSTEESERIRDERSIVSRDSFKKIWENPSSRGSGQSYKRGIDSREPRMAKFMASLNEETFQILFKEAKSRGISVQELLRAVIVPDWIRELRMSNVITTPQIAVPRAYTQSQ